MRFEKLENDLTNLLLHNIVVYINPDKPIKKGKLKLFSVKEFYYILTLENDKNELKDYELPMPFKWQLRDNHVIFDYSLSSFTKNNEFVEFKSKVLNFKKKSKFYNNMVVLSAV
jgi:hypothetical protein